MRKRTLGLTVVLAVVLAAYVTVAQPARPARPQHPVMVALDTDKNGEISADEIAKSAASLKKLDRNKDGKLAIDETRPRRGGRGPRPAPRGGGSTPESKAMPKDDAEKKILDVLADMQAKERRGMMNVSPTDGRLLRLLAENTGAKHVVEIGTSNGYSGIWLCMALRKTGGKLTTHEIDARRASLARKNFKRAGVDKIVTLVEGDAHKEVSKIKGPIDILFMDADKEGYIDYLKKLTPLVRPGGLIIAHNTRSHAGGMQPYIKAITTNADFETLFLLKDGAGVGVTMKKR